MSDVVRALPTGKGDQTHVFLVASEFGTIGPLGGLFLNSNDVEVSRPPMPDNLAKTVVTAVLIAEIQKQRVKLQKAMKKYGRMSVNAFKRLDFEKGVTNGAKALAARQADQFLAQQQEKLRRDSR